MSTDAWGAPPDIALARALPALVRKRLDQAQVVALRALAPFGLPALVARWGAERPGRLRWCDLRSESDARFAEAAASGMLGAVLHAPEDDPPVLVVVGAERLTDEGVDRLIAQAAARGEARLVLVTEDVPRGLPGAATPIGPADARYTREDCAQAFADAGITLTDEALSRVIDETEGWPRLVDAIVDACPPEGLGHDPEAEIDLALAPIRAARAAWLPERWDALADYFVPTGNLAWSEIEALAELDATAIAREMIEMGAVRRETGERAIRCLALHPLLHRVLRERLTRRDRHEATALLRSAAILRDRIGVLDCGLTAALEAQDWSLCSAIIDRHVLPLTFTSAWRDVQRAMLAMPTEALRENPYTSLRAELLGLLPLGTTPVTIPASPAEAQRVHRTGESRRILERTQVAIAARRVFGRLDEAREIALRTAPIIELCQRTPGAPATAYAPVWCLQAGLSCYLAGDGPAARSFFDRGWQLRQDDATGFTALDLAAKLATYEAVHGDADQARRWLTEAETGPDLPMPFHAWVYSGFRVAELALATDALDLETAERVSQLIDDEIVRNEMWPFLLWAQARLDLLLGQPHRVLERVDEARRVYADSIASRALSDQICTALVAQARLALGQGTEADRLLAALPADTPIGLPTRVWLRLLDGRLAEARNLAADARSRPTTPLRDRVELALIEAGAALRLDDRQNAVELLGRGFELLSPRDHRSAFATIPRGLLDELAVLAPVAAESAAELDRRDLGAIYPERIDVIVLTERERVVLTALATGGTLEQIARRLHVSLNTVKSQARVLYAKLGVHNRAEAVAEGRRLGLIDD